MKKLTVKKGTQCMACLECVRACSEAFYKEFDPSKACLQIIERNGAAKPMVCVQCGKCAEVCEHGAITQNAKGVYSIVGFELDHTLSESGSVSRGICAYDKEQHLTDIVEHLNIAREADGKVYGDNSLTGETHVELVADNLCSMNMWGFTPDYFEKSEKIFESFLEQNINELKKEFYIPYAIDCMIKSGEAQTDVLSTPSHWFGVTYKEDRPAVVAKFQEFADKGVYPTPLYTK